MKRLPALFLDGESRRDVREGSAEVRSEKVEE